MKIDLEPARDSYEAALTAEQRVCFRSVLMSEMTLTEVQHQAAPWPHGPQQGKPPSLTSLFRARCRLRIQEKVARIEDARIATRATRTLLRRLVKGTDKSKVLDEAVALLGQKLIDGCLGLDKTAIQMGAAWLLLRREDQRLAAERLDLLRSQTEKQPEGPDRLPPLSDEEREARDRAILGMDPE